MSSLQSDSRIVPRNKELIQRFLRDCELGKTIKRAQKKRIGVGRRLNTSAFYGACPLGWGNPLTK